MANPLVFPVPIGLIVGGASISAGTYALDGATKKVGLMVVAPATSKSLTKVQVRVSAVTGTLVAGDVQCDIYATSAGAPTGASLGTSTTVDALPTGAAFIEFTFTAIALTAGVAYWACITCPNAASGRYVTVQYGGSGSLPPYLGTGSRGWLAVTYDGASWGTPTRACFGLRVGYSDGTYAGLSVASVTSVQNTDAAYEAREQAAAFTMPLNAKWNVIGGWGFVRKTGTPAGNARLRLYSGTTLLATSVSVVQADVATAYFICSYFTSAVEVTGGTELRLAIGTTEGGSTSAYYRFYTLEIEDSETSRSLVPYEWGKDYFNSEWTGKDLTSLPIAGLLLDTDSELGVNTVIVVED